MHRWYVGTHREQMTDTYATITRDSLSTGVHRCACSRHEIQVATEPLHTQITIGIKVQGVLTMKEVIERRIKPPSRFLEDHDQNLRTWYLESARRCEIIHKQGRYVKDVNVASRDIRLHKAVFFQRGWRNYDNAWMYLATTMSTGLLRSTKETFESHLLDACARKIVLQHSKVILWSPESQRNCPFKIMIRKR